MRPIKRRRVGFIVLLTVCIALVSYVGHRAFRIWTIEVEGEGVAIRVDQSELPKNLLFFPSEKIAKRLLAENPTIANITIRKKFPHTLVLNVTPRKALALVKSGEVTAIVDTEGVLISYETRRESLPVIDVAAELGVIGSRIANENVMSAISLLNQTHSFLNIQKITNTDSQSLIASFDKTNILFTQNSNGFALATTLQTLLSGFRIKGIMPTTIDLRFDKPIVTF